MKNGKSVGGMARVANIIRNLKKKSIHPLVVDAGDVFQGSTLYSRYHGEVEVKLLNMIGYDIFTLGNHEFDNGSSNVAEKFSRAKFDVINCNLDMGPVPALDKLVKSSVVKTIDGKKVAFVGAVTPELELLSGGLEGAKLKAKGDGWVRPIKKEVERLSRNGINKIILVTHCGVNEDRELAEAIPQIDAIIGGHSHTRLDNRIIVKHDDGTTTTIVQTGSYGRAVGKLVLKFDDKGVVNVKASRYRLYDVTDRIESDPDVDQYVKTMVQPLLPLRETIAGIAGKRFAPKITYSDSPMGDIICDALVKAGKNYGVTIALHNRGGTRAVLEKGPVSLENIEMILPFDNFAVFATITGKTLMKVLEHGVGGSLGGRFLDVHGIKLAYDKSRPDGNRVIFALAKSPDGSWLPLEDEKQYKIAINHYNFDGGEGYNFSGAKNVKRTKLRMAKVLENYLIARKKVWPKKPHRIILVNSDLLHVQASDNLKVNGLAPWSRLSLVAGSGPGVSTIYNAFPVPVENAKIIQTKVKADKDGSFLWKSLSSTIDEKDSRKLCDASRKLWLCVVAYPPKRGKSKKSYRSGRKARTMISSPVDLTVTR